MIEFRDTFHRGMVVLLLCFLIGGLLWRNQTAHLRHGQSTQRAPPSRTGASGIKSKKPNRSLAETTEWPSIIGDGEIATLEFPFIGKVVTRWQKHTLVIRGSDERLYELPFKFYYDAAGVWVRAEYVGNGKPTYEEERPDILQLMYTRNGERIVGLPAAAPKHNPSEVLRAARRSFPIEDASMIVLENFLMVTPESEETAGTIHFMTKIWGVPVPVDMFNDSTPRVRFLMSDETSLGFMDNML